MSSQNSAKCLSVKDEIVEDVNLFKRPASLGSFTGENYYEEPKLFNDDGIIDCD